jgi:hypothetical protein
MAGLVIWRCSECAAHLGFLPQVRPVACGACGLAFTDLIINDQIEKVRAR